MEVCEGVCTAIGLIRVVLAVVVSITDVCWVSADTSTTLELAWSTFKLSCSERTKRILLKQNIKKKYKLLYYNTELTVNNYYNQSTSVTHGILLVHLSGPRSHLQCHTSTKMECICHFCIQTKRTEKIVIFKKIRTVFIYVYGKNDEPCGGTHLTCSAVGQALFAISC